MLAWKQVGFAGARSVSTRRPATDATKAAGSTATMGRPSAALKIILRCDHDFIGTRAARATGSARQGDGRGARDAATMSQPTRDKVETTCGQGRGR